MTHDEFMMLKVGDTVRIIADYGKHNEPVGNIVVITQVAAREGAYFINSSGATMLVRYNEIVAISMDKNLLNEQLVKAEQTVTDLKNKLAYLAESGAEKFDEIEFQCYQALKISEDTTQPLHVRAKALSALISKW